MLHDPNGTEEEEDLYSGSDGGSNQLTGEGGIKLDASAAKWPEYANRIERIDTYKKWPKPKIDVNELAEAGMFYKGEDDRTECYYCGIPLKLWEIHDEPWIEHARFSQDCLFLHFHKGWAFVKAALEFYDLPTVGLQIQRASNIEPGYGTTESSVPVGQSSTEPQPRSTPAPKPKRIIRRVEPREIRSRLDMDRCKKLMALGYPRELVGQVIGERLQTEADDFDNYGELVAAVMNAAEMLGIPLHTTSMQVPNTFPGASGANAKEGGSTSYPPLSVAGQTGAAGSSAGEGNLDPAVKRAMEENKSLKQKLYCKKCWKKEVNVVLLNCGHMVLCEDCAKLVHICPRCHNHILQRVKVFVA